MLTALSKRFVLSFLFNASSARHPDLTQSHIQVLQGTQKSALRIDTTCTRSTLTTHLHAETKKTPLYEWLLGSPRRAYISCYKGLHNSLGTCNSYFSSIHAIATSHLKILRATIFRRPLVKAENSWLHKIFVARTFVNSSPITFLKEATLYISVQMRLTCIDRTECTCSPPLWALSVLLPIFSPLTIENQFCM